jgi:hypothetical protein
MKRFYIEDFILFNQGIEKPYQRNPKDIFKVALFDLDSDLYYQCIYTDFYDFSHITYLKERLNNSIETVTLQYFSVDKTSINNLEESFPISDQKFNEILNMKVSIFKRYYKNNFLKLINLEEMII